MLLALETQYMSPRQLLTAPDEQTNALVLVNINVLSRDLLENLELAFGIYNLLNRANVDPGSSDHLQTVLPLDGTHLRLTAAYSF